MGHNPLGTSGSLARAFSQPAALSDGPEAYFAIVPSNRINEMINGVFGQHLTFTEQRIFGIVLCHP